MQRRPSPHTMRVKRKPDGNQGRAKVLTCEQANLDAYDTSPGPHPRYTYGASTLPELQEGKRRDLGPSVCDSL